MESVVPDRVPWTAVAVFTVVAMLLAWVVCLPLWISGSGLEDLVRLQICAAAMMFTPMIATVIAIIVQRRTTTGPSPKITRYLGIWPLRPASRVVGMMLIAFFGTIVLCALPLVLAAVVGWADADLTGRAGVSRLAGSEPFDGLGPSLLLAVVLLAIVPNTLITAIPAFGEEVGWRGWLLTSLRPLGTWPALIITGTIWGLWHSPLILLGYNFGRPNLAGVALMTGGCVAVGVLFGWVRLRSGSVWPAVLAHGALNSATPTFILLATRQTNTPDGAYVSALGFPGWIVIAIITAGLILAGQFRSVRFGELRPATAPNSPVAPSEQAPAGR